MSRKKKSATKNGVKNDSWYLIKEQIKKKVVNTFKKDAWYRKGEKDNYFFPYKKRHPLMMAMCGEYPLLADIPAQWSEIFSRLLNSRDAKTAAFAQAMLDIDEEEWRTGTLDNKNFNKICKSIGAKDKIDKPKIMSVLDWMNPNSIEVAREYAGIKDVFTKERTRNRDSVKIYISCDPWDIFRMGVGKDDLGSCMNIIDNGNAGPHVPPNFQDPSMALVYAEDVKDHRKLKGLRSRCILRMLRNGDEYGVVVDRLYGSNAYRSSMLKAVENAAKKVGMKLYKFSTYKHTVHSHSVVKNEGREFQASGPLTKFRIAMPYLDQGGSGGFVELMRDGNNIVVVPTYKVVETDEAVA